jgi:antitoxin component of RelBE/YafQ-DinJ toxin-antitoxin module
MQFRIKASINEKIKEAVKQSRTASLKRLGLEIQ